MLALAPVLVQPPKVVIADEPTLGLAPLVVAQVLDVFRELRDLGTTILLVEEKIRDVLTVADRAAFIELGHIVWSGERADLMTSSWSVPTLARSSRHPIRQESRS